MKNDFGLYIYNKLLEEAGIRYYCKFKDTKDERYYYLLINHLLEHFRGRSVENLWVTYLEELILKDDNIFSEMAERGDNVPKKILQMVMHDLNKLRALASFDISKLSAGKTEILLGFRGKKAAKGFFDNNMIEMFRFLHAYHKKEGRGIFVSNYVFKIDNGGNLIPITHYDEVMFEDLIGYERQIGTIQANTLALIEGKACNNVLLYGERGTGKSSTVKALLNKYKYMGLRVIEMKKSQFNHLPSVSNMVRNRKHKFILFIDDLSFEKFETEYKDLKAALEGSFENKPDNLIIMVTSNRRHLIRESFTDRDEDVHGRESVSEQLSLFDRFGITIYFEPPDEELYFRMVTELASKNQISLSEVELRSKANEWKVAKAVKSGRSAQQFVESLKIR
ncbi:ATP-binding protein [Alkalibacter mobilis]|uniref:ATP-binding protein n=1 Tax=Alkalibacter mobilis TaxID=2787712 RepID=UPI0018A068B0|nr:ATP-binding protein [Alkalibacter mobilis]MBF7096550.1 ATP-binding protein [Alkalibacter mobilis]